jgi:outer membrane biosynthesis protein TonB
LRDHSHIYEEHSDVCSHCGQPLPGRAAPTYGRQGPNRPALVGTILLHALLVLIWLFHPDKDAKQAKPATGNEGEVVYVAPMQQPSKTPPREQAPLPTPTLKTPPLPRPERIEIARLPDTITLPDEKPVEQTKPEPQKKFDEQKPVDMADFIASRRRQRGAADGSEDTTPESEATRGMRNAMNNIASINGRGREDRNETGGVFSVSNKTFHSMDLKFRGWNPNFKRRWLTQVTVEQGSEADVEIAVVKKMIELIRREKTGDFEWDSHRLGRIVKLSARPQDTDELMTFLFKEMFPEYKPPQQWR